MATSQLSKAIQHLRRTTLRWDGAGLPDRQLLERFIEHGEEAAFEALVRRHGQTIWGVCRRVLRNHHDAEDAFQATFLVLARKAASIVPREMVANWLYGVAYRTALKARATTGRRRVRERQVTNMPDPASVEQNPWHDLEPLLERALAGLPDKYRVAILLCDLEGKTRKEAARHLAIPEGTVSSRLATARLMLAKRLTRGRLLLSAGTLAAALSQGAASSCPSRALVASATKAAIVFAGGSPTAGMISAKVAGLTEGVLKTMLLTKVKIATTLVLGIALVATATSILTSPTPASDHHQAGHESAPNRSGPRVLDAHNHTVQSIAFSPDSKTLASAGADGRVKLWDATTGQLKRVLRGHTAVAFSPDGKSVAAVRDGQAGQDSREVVLWDAKSGEEKQTLTGITGFAQGLAFSPDGAMLAVGSGFATPRLTKRGAVFPPESGEVTLWSLRTGKLQRRVTKHTSLVMSVAFGPDGKTLATASCDKTVKLWDVRTGRLRQTLQHEGAVGAVTFSREGKTIASCSRDDGSIRLWVAKTGQLRRKLPGDKLVYSLAFAPDGNTLASAHGAEHAVRLWDPKSGRLKQTLKEREYIVSCVTFSPDGRRLANTGADLGSGLGIAGKIVLWPLDGDNQK